MFSIKMKLGLWRLCLAVIIERVAFGRIFDGINREKKSFVKHTQFAPTVRYKVCLLNPQRGPCRSNINMYYFNPETMSCSRFEWGGCQGNGNRFDTRSQCLEYCIKTTFSDTLPTFCKLSFDYGYCFGDMKVYYYDAKWQVCKKALFSGCGGNENKFKSKKACEATCVFRQDQVTFNGYKKRKGLKTVIVVDPPNTTPFRGKSRGKNSNANFTRGTFIRRVVNASGVFFKSYHG